MLTTMEPIQPRKIKNLVFLGSFPQAPQESTLPEFAFVGRSNVGKSSAINALLNRKKAARVSRTPGRTQLINLFEIDEELRFVDLPGYGFAKVPAHVRKNWKIMIEGYLFARPALLMRNLCCDWPPHRGRLVWALLPVPMIHSSPCV